MGAGNNDYEFGSQDREGTLQRIREADLAYETEVRQRKLEGRWPPSTYRDPHPWENGVVKPPPPDDGPPKKPVLPPDQQRLSHLLACCKLMKGCKKPIPSHLLTEIVGLRKHWQGFDIPPEAIEARRVLERT